MVGGGNCAVTAFGLSWTKLAKVLCLSRSRPDAKKIYIKVYPKTCTYCETFAYAKLSGLSLSLVRSK